MTVEEPSSRVVRGVLRSRARALFWSNCGHDCSPENQRLVGGLVGSVAIS